MYSKLGGSYDPAWVVHINQSIVCDLLWLAKRVRESDGVFLLDSIVWLPDQAQMIIHTNASLTGFGFWCDLYDKGFYGYVKASREDDPIFFHEAFTVVCSIHWVASLRRADLQRILVRTDNTNTVDLFNTLRAKAGYNELLKFAVDSWMRAQLDIQVVHVAGTNNTLANLLSRRKIREA